MPKDLIQQLKVWPHKHSIVGPISIDFSKRDIMCSPSVTFPRLLHVNTRVHSPLGVTHTRRRLLISFLNFSPLFPILNVKGMSRHGSCLEVCGVF